MTHDPGYKPGQPLVVSYKTRIALHVQKSHATGESNNL